MIGLDTNVLIRLFVDDPSNRAQVAVARRFVSQAKEPIRISLVVVVEAVWTLRRQFGVRKAGLLQFLNLLLDDRRFQIESRAAIEDALDAYGRSSLDYADCLIERTNEAAGVSRTYTFDRAACARRHFALLEA